MKPHDVKYIYLMSAIKGSDEGEPHLVQLKIPKKAHVFFFKKIFDSQNCQIYSNKLTMATYSANKLFNNGYTFVEHHIDDLSFEVSLY